VSGTPRIPMVPYPVPSVEELQRVRLADVFSDELHLKPSIARPLRELLKTKPEARVFDALFLKGIGSATLARLCAEATRMQKTG
jgi:hypothetical protein